MGIPARPRVPRQTPAGPSTPQQAARKAGVQDSEERCKSAYWDCSLAPWHPPATKQAPARRGMSQHAPACPGRPQQAAARPSRPQQAPARPNRPQQAARKAGVQDFEERCKSAYGDCSLASSHPPGARQTPQGSSGRLLASPGRPPGASWRPPGGSGGQSACFTHPGRPGSQSERENTALGPPRRARSACFHVSGGRDGPRRAKKRTKGRRSSRRSHAVFPAIGVIKSSRAQRRPRAPRPPPPAGPKRWIWQGQGTSMWTAKYV